MDRGRFDRLRGTLAIGVVSYLLGLAAHATAEPPPPQPPAASTPPEEVSVTAPEPRYVAPTLRDRIGRIWAPVLINGKGPFRLVLDTGASQSAITAQVAEALGMPLDEAPVLLYGVTGTASVRTVHATTLEVGDLLMSSPVLPIVPDALGGAQGVLGTEGLLEMRIFIDFRHDQITISRSRMHRADEGFQTIPVHITQDRLLSINARVGSIKVKAIVDTGSQGTIANFALRDAMFRWHKGGRAIQDQIQGVTGEIRPGEDLVVPVIDLGGVLIRSARATLSDTNIFERWNLASQPALLIGMDTLGTLDTLVIDYKRKELQIRTHCDGCLHVQ
jgi:predicted aspartyl protease